MWRVAPLIALLLSVEAEAAKRKIAVVDLAAPPMMMGLGSLVTQAIVRQAQKDPTLTVITPDQVKLILGDKGVTSLTECMGQASCVAGQAGALNADLIVAGTFDRTPTSYLVRLWLIDMKSRQAISSVDRSILIASRRLTTDVEEAIPEFLKGRAEITGKLKITTNAKNARVSIDGEAVGTTPYDGDLKPGKHTVRLERFGYLAVERFATVEPNQTVTLDVAMVAIPGYVEAEVAAAAKQPEKKEEQPSRPGYQIPIATFVVGGVAIVAVGTGVYFGETMKSIQDKAVPVDASGTLGITRTQALSAQQDAAFANYAYIGAGVLGVAAVVIAIVAGGTPSGDKPSAAPTAAVSPAGATFGIGGRF
jgi:hypothetical protein